MLIDAAVHVWSDDAATYPWAPIGGQEWPDKPATATQLIAELAQVGFEGAICIQPRVYGYDHGYLVRVLSAYPDRFAGVCLVDPEDPAAGNRLEQLVAECGFAGVRLLPFSEPEADWLTRRANPDLWRAVSRLAVPVSILPRPDQLADVRICAAEHPDTTLVVDHLGLVSPDEGTRGIDELLACAELANVRVKLSAFGFLSRTPWPHEDLFPLLRRVTDEFGPGRVLFGTDWPNTRTYGPYQRSLQVLERALDLDDSARRLVLGGNAHQLWRSRPTR